MYIYHAKIAKNSVGSQESPSDNAYTATHPSLFEQMIQFWNANERLKAYEIAEQLRSIPQYSAQALSIIALYQYDTGDLRKSLLTFKELGTVDSANHMAQQWIAKLTLELDERSELSKNASEHFYLRYEGTGELYEYQSQLLELLESEYAALSLKLNFYPKAPFEVILYSDPRYSGVTALPDWAAASFDGKIRLPVQAIREMHTQKGVVIHELTHAFLQAMCPQLPLWFHEGVAQFFAETPIQKELLVSSEWPSFDALTQSFIAIKERERVGVLYQISLAMIYELVNAESLDIIPQILKGYDHTQGDESFLKESQLTPHTLYARAHARFKSG